MCEVGLVVGWTTPDVGEQYTVVLRIVAGAKREQRQLGVWGGIRR